MPSLIRKWRSYRKGTPSRVAPSSFLLFTNFCLLPSALCLFFLPFAFCLSFLPLSSFAQKTLWTTGNGRTLAKGQQEFGIVQPFQIGITDNVELSVSPPAGLTLVPNVSVKVRYTGGPWFIATQHGYLFPTMLLHAIQDNKFGFLPPDWNLRVEASPDIPNVYSFRNQVLVTRKIGEETLLTGHAGIDFSLKSDSASSVNLTYPLVYRQNLPSGGWKQLQPKLYPLLFMWSTTLQDKAVWFAGARADGNLYKNFNYMAEVEFVASGFDIAHWAVEHKGYLIWNKSVKFAALIGYRMSYGTYPDLTQNPVVPYGRFFIMPVADLIWKLNIQRNHDKGLFPGK